MLLFLCLSVAQSVRKDEKVSVDPGIRDQLLKILDEPETGNDKQLGTRARRALLGLVKTTKETRDVKRQRSRVNIVRRRVEALLDRKGINEQMFDTLTKLPHMIERAQKARKRLSRVEKKLLAAANLVKT